MVGSLVVGAFFLVFFFFFKSRERVELTLGIFK